jgi:S1-C subfamily serine protease
LVNLDGKAVGINIARAGRVASYALPASLAERIIEGLKAQAGINANGK